MAELNIPMTDILTVIDEIMAKSTWGTNVTTKQEKLEEVQEYLKDKTVSASESVAIALLFVKMHETSIEKLKEEASEIPKNTQDINEIKEKLESIGESNAISLLFAKIHESAIKNSKIETINTTLTNTKEYPFNNSKKTIALKEPRNNLHYIVNAEAIQTGSGGIGEIRITDKQLNGFKIEFTGAAKSVNVQCSVQGGYI